VECEVVLVCRSAARSVALGSPVSVQSHAWQVASAVPVMPWPAGTGLAGTGLDVPATV